MTKLDDAGLDLLFRHAHTARAFLPDPVGDDELRAVWELARLPPTGGNANPLRIAFVRSPEAKERLRPMLAPGNVDKTMAAPVTAIFAFDLEFYEHMPRLFPQVDMRSRFAADPVAAEASARLNATLQAAYFMIAARATGLDCGPMGGFDAARTSEVFFAGTSWRALFLCNLGHADKSKNFPRASRFDFDEACKVL